MANISEEKLCEVCRGKGSIIVRKAICTEPMERIETCPACGGRGCSSGGSRRTWRFWRHR